MDKAGFTQSPRRLNEGTFEAVRDMLEYLWKNPHCPTLKQVWEAVGRPGVYNSLAVLFNRYRVEKFPKDRKFTPKSFHEYRCEIVMEDNIKRQEEMSKENGPRESLKSLVEWEELSEEREQPAPTDNTIDPIWLARFLKEWIKLNNG